VLTGFNAILCVLFVLVTIVGVRVSATCRIVVQS
jgi:hypothetical protein